MHPEGGEGRVEKEVICVHQQFLLVVWMNNAERWENATLYMKRTSKVLQATLFLNEHSDTALSWFNQTTQQNGFRWSSIFVLALTSSRSKYYLWTASREKFENYQPIYFTVGFRKDNAWHSLPLLHWQVTFLLLCLNFPSGNENNKTDLIYIVLQNWQI